MFFKIDIRPALEIFVGVSVICIFAALLGALMARMVM